MRAPGVLPAVALIVGAACGITGHLPGSLVATLSTPAAFAALIAGLALLAAVAWWTQRPGMTAVLLAAAFAVVGAAAAADAVERALHTPLRAALQREFGGFALERWDAAGRHDPVPTRARLLVDAAPGEIRGAPVTLRAEVLAVRLSRGWVPVSGGVTISIGGSIGESSVGRGRVGEGSAGQGGAGQVGFGGGRRADAGDDGGQASQDGSGGADAVRLQAWVAGRTIEAPMTFRRAARYADAGVPDLERDLALRGVTLLASVKSALLVEVREGSRVAEAAGRARTSVRTAVGRWVAPRSAIGAGIVTAILIGDRAGIPEDVRERLRAAGTYHVIAISGGNIAVLVAVLAALPLVAGASARAAAWPCAVMLALYSQIVVAGPSVWRATLMALLHLAATSADHRSPPAQVVAVAAAVMVLVRPLDLLDPGFVLTFGATVALIAAAGVASPGARGALMRLPGPAKWLLAAVLATAAVDLALLPVSAQSFGRVTVAGLVSNLCALPLMAVAQMCGMGVVALDLLRVAAAGPGANAAGPAGLVAWPSALAAWPSTMAGWAGALAAWAAMALVESARLVDLAPWSSRLVPAPGALLLTAYYGAGLLAWWTRGYARAAACLVAGGALAAVWTGTAVTVPTHAGALAGSNTRHAPLRLTLLDVGQGESILVQPPGASGAVLIDAGGSPFGGDRFEIARLVVAPALRALGVTRLDELILTHGDPDHIGGASGLLDRFDVARVTLGIVVPGHQPTARLAAQARASGTSVVLARTGQALRWGDARIRVLHPPEPDWERRRVRNDDSVVVEVVYGDVALLLTGDVSAEVERALLPRLTPARRRILKVAHHGSRTSTSTALVEGWRPEIALISCGRGNAFGHPTPEAVARLANVGARVYRTDLDGAVTIESDGRDIRVRTTLRR